MHRRRFLCSGLAAFSFGAVAARRPARRSAAASVMTVEGPVPPRELGLTLAHEHVLVDFGGAAVAGPDRYDREEAFAAVLPHAQAAYDAGVRTLIEATPPYLGRDALLLRRLARATGLRFVTCTGLYGARDDEHLPPYAFEETPDELAARWIAEWSEGIGTTGIRPGFIKIGVDPGARSAVDRKLVRAAARAHLQTGLTIAVHTGPAPGAIEQLAILGEEGVAARAWIWVHAQQAEDSAALVEAARQGAWVELDGLRPESAERHLALVNRLKAEDLLKRVLLSQDAGWYRVGEPGGSPERFRPYTFLTDEFVPMLKEAGFSDADVRRLLVENPAEAFAVRVRAR